MLAADMFKCPSGKIDIPEVSAATGREMLFYCYTGHVRPTAVVKVPYPQSSLAFVVNP
jgi:hypothetical protein